MEPDDVAKDVALCLDLTSDKEGVARMARHLAVKFEREREDFSPTRFYHRAGLDDLGYSIPGLEERIERLV